MIVTGHQINLLPGLSVVEKIAAADACVLCDLMQFERHSWSNRNRFTGGGWMTVPVHQADVFKPSNEVRIADPGNRVRRKIGRTIEHAIGAERAAPYVEHLNRPYELLLGLTYPLLTQMLRDLKVTTELHLQSQLAAGRTEPYRAQLAAMTRELGGDVWLSGPLGPDFFDRDPVTRDQFELHDVELRVWDHGDRPNPCALANLKAGSVSGLVPTGVST